jgi:hypothetical protein
MQGKPAGDDLMMSINDETKLADVRAAQGKLTIPAAKE